MVEKVKYIKFEEVLGAPDIAVPQDFTQDQINQYLKSDYVEQIMAEKGFAFKYGLQPVNQLELENLDDWHLTSGLKKGWLSAKSIGQGALTWFYDAVGNEEAQKEALTAARQYQLDRAALAYQVDDEGNLLPRIEKVEDIINDERHLTAFTKYVREKFGEGAATSFPTLLLSAVGAGVGAVAGSFAAPGVGTAAGAKLGATGGALLSGFVFGLGETYLSQAEETEDPNLALSVALAIPYAAAERLGIGGVVPSLVKTFGSPENAAKAMHKSKFWSPLIKGGKINYKTLAGKSLASVGRTGLEEGLAESIQETITTFGGGVEAGKTFDEMFNNKEFAKQLGEAAAAGFFGGLPFGTINPTLKAINVLNKAGGVNDKLDGATLGATLNDDSEQEEIQSAPFNIGDTVTVNNQYNPDVTLERQKELEKRFGKPKFTVRGTTEVEMTKGQGPEKVFVLQSDDIKPTVVLLRNDQINSVNVEKDAKSGGEVAEQKENFIYEGQATTNKLNKETTQAHSERKRKLVQNGYLPDANETSITKFLESDDRIVRETANRIITARQEQKGEIETYENTPQEDREEDLINFVPKLDATYAKYDAVPDEELETAVKEDLPFWRTVQFEEDSQGLDEEVLITPEQEQQLKDLGYFGDRGQAYINEKIRVRTNPVNKTTSEGKQLLDSIIKNGTRFSSIPDILGGPVTVRRKIGEKVITNEPLTAQEKASLSGDRLIAATKYDPSTYTEEMTFEDLYNKPVEVRMRIIEELAEKLDAKGWKRSKINDPYLKALEKELRTRVNVARFKYGDLSTSYQQASEELKKFQNTGEHVLINSFAPAGQFSLVPILSPNALKTYNNIINELKRNIQSEDPVVRKKAEEQLPVYENIVEQVIEFRLEINQLLKSMSIEPILDWNTVSATSIKSKLNKYRKKLNQTEPETKTKNIYANYTMLNIDPYAPGEAYTADHPLVQTAVKANLLQILSAFRTRLDQLGLASVDVAMLNNASSNLMSGDRNNYGVTAKGVYAGTENMPLFNMLASRVMKKEGINDFVPNLSFSLIEVSFDIERYNKASPFRKAEMLSNAFSTLNHEAIHAMKDLGLYTKQEWSILEQAADEHFINDYQIASRYSHINSDPTLSAEQKKAIIREEAIARAFQAFLKGEIDPPPSKKNILQKLFDRMKAFLSLLGFSFGEVGYTNAYEIFDATQAGIIGQRAKARKDIQDIQSQEIVEKTLAINPMGTLIASNNLVSTPSNIKYHKNILTYLISGGEFRTIDEVLDEVDRTEDATFTPEDLPRFNDKVRNEKYVNQLKKVLTLNKPLNVKFNIDAPRMVITAKEMQGIGGIDIVKPYQSMYVSMTPEQFLSLVPGIEKGKPAMEYSEKNLKWMAQQVMDGKEFGIPYLEIQIDEGGGVGRIYGHEGRHRASTAATFNGLNSNMPVAVRFIKERDKSVYKANKEGRYDVANAEFLKQYIAEGIVEGQQGSTAARQPIRNIFNKVYENIETNEDGSFNFSKPYTNNFAANTAVRYDLGSAQDPANKQSRPQKKQTTKKLTEAIKDGEELYIPDKSVSTRKMSYFSRMMGHARAWAKFDTPFRQMYGVIIDRLRKIRSLQGSFTAILKKRYLEVKKDPRVNEMINKAHIIMEMTGEFPEFNENGELIFIAPADGGATDLEVKQGEVVALTGDVALAMKDHQLVMASVVKEDLKATIARDHIEDLIEALTVLRVFMPNLPEFKTIFNFEGLKKEQIEYVLENLDRTQIKFIVDNLSNIMIGRGTVTGEYADIINKLLGSPNVGLNKLLTAATVAEQYMTKPYVPLQRFGNIYITVVDDEGKTLWYETFEGLNATNRAREKRSELIAKYPNATVSQPEKITIDEIRRLVQRAAADDKLSIEFLAQYMTDVNARRFESAMQEVRQVLADKGLDKDITPMSAYRQPRKKDVGIEGVPGYSADFTRATMQYLMVASDAIGRNRYNPAIRHHYNETLKYALNKKDEQLRKATQEYFKYTEDPLQEFSEFRRLGFWWYLGGNMSSAVLQTMSLVQMTGPLLSQVAGVAPTAAELTKAVADAGSMLSISQRQYEDAFINFDKIKTILNDTEGLADAVFNSVADGTIKQGQALQEAGVVPGPGGTLVGSQGAINKNFRKFENVFVGGAFNTVEAISRMTAFIAAYRLASKNPKILEQAELLYGNDLDYQNMKDRFGNGPEAFAKFMVEETFGVYGKENRPRLARGFGSLPALFMTYISQMFGLLYRLLNPFNLAADKSPLQNKIGRRAFARIMVMMLITGGLFGMPGGEDAEDLYNILKRQITGLDEDVRSEFRNMLYNAGFGPGMIEALESGLVNTMFNIDVQRRIGFGVAPWSTQVRAIGSLMGIDTGARAEEFLGAPGSVFIDSFNNFATLGLREGRWGDAITNSLPLGIKNPVKGLDYMFGEGYVTTSYGQVVTDDIGAIDVVMQMLGFTPSEISRNREAMYLMRKLQLADSRYKQRMNARIENAYVKIIMGGRNKNGALINEGQAELQKITKDVMKHNQNNPNKIFIPDLKRKFDDALRAADPNYAIYKGKQELINQKLRIREQMGLN